MVIAYAMQIVFMKKKKKNHIIFRPSQKLFYKFRRLKKFRDIFNKYIFYYLKEMISYEKLTRLEIIISIPN